MNNPEPSRQTCDAQPGSLHPVGSADRQRLTEAIATVANLAKVIHPGQFCDEDFLALEETLDTMQTRTVAWLATEKPNTELRHHDCRAKSTRE